MDCYTLMILASVAMVASAWSIPFYPIHRGPQIRVTRYAPLPHSHRFPIRSERYVKSQQERPKPERPKREYDNDDDQDDHNHNSNDDHTRKSGVTGPVHTFVKTDKNANYKWGVRLHVGNKFAS